MKNLFAIISAVSLFMGSFSVCTVNAENKENTFSRINKLIIEEDSAAYVNDSAEPSVDYARIEEKGSFNTYDNKKGHNGKYKAHSWTEESQNSMRYYPRLSAGTYNVSVYVPSESYQVGVILSCSDGKQKAVDNPTLDYGQPGPSDFVDYGNFKFSGIYGEDYIELSQRMTSMHPGYNYNTGWWVYYDAVKFELVSLDYFKMTDNTVKMKNANQLKENDYIEIKTTSGSFCENVDASMFKLTGGISVKKIERIDQNTVRIYPVGSTTEKITENTECELTVSKDAGSGKNDEVLKFILEKADEFLLDAKITENENIYNINVRVKNNFENNTTGKIFICIYDGQMMKEKREYDVNEDVAGGFEINEDTDVSQINDPNIGVFMWDDKISEENGKSKGGKILAEAFYYPLNKRTEENIKADDFEIFVDEKKEMVTISGKAEAERIALQVVSGADTDYINEIKTNNEKCFEHTYRLKNAKSGEIYSVYIRDNDRILKKDFVFYTDEYKNKIFSEAKKYSGEKFNLFIKENSDVFGIDTGKNSEYDKLSDSEQREASEKFEIEFKNCTDIKKIPQIFNEIIKNASVKTLILEENGKASVNGGKYTDGYGRTEIIGASAFEKDDGGHNGMYYHNWTDKRVKSMRYYPKLGKGIYRVLVFVPDRGYQVGVEAEFSDGQKISVNNSTLDYGERGPADFVEYGSLAATGKYGTDYVELYERITSSIPGYSYNTGWGVYFDAVKFELVTPLCLDITDNRIKMQSTDIINPDDFIEIRTIRNSFKENLNETNFQNLPFGMRVGKIEKIDDKCIRVYFEGTLLDEILEERKFRLKVKSAVAGSDAEENLECILEKPDLFVIDADVTNKDDSLSVNAQIMNSFNQTQKATALLGVYDDNKMIAKKLFTLDELKKNEKKIISEKFDVKGIENPKIKIFVWDNVEITKGENDAENIKILAKAFVYPDKKEEAQVYDKDRFEFLYDCEKKTVTLKGKSSAEKAVIISYRDKNLDYFDEADTKDNGYFNYTYMLNNPLSGEENEAFVYTSEKGIIGKGRFVFYKDSYREETFQNAKKKSGEDFINYIESVQDILEIDLSEKSIYNSLSQDGKNNFRNELEKIKNSCKNQKEFKDEFSKLSTGMMIADDINNALNTEEVIKIIESEKDFLGFDLNEDFEENKEEIAKNLFENNYNNIDELKEDYYNTFYLSVFNSIEYTDRKSMEEKLYKYRNELEIPENFFGKDKGTYIKHMMGITFKDKNDIKESAASAMKNSDSSDKKPAGGSSGGGSSGGGGGVSAGSNIVPVKPKIQAEENKNCFDDLSSVLWAEEAIEELARRNIVSGKAEGKFAPDDKVTRAEFAKMAVLSSGSFDESLETESFTDVNENDWFMKYIANAEKRKIINGKDDKSFGVNDNITREDMCVIIYRQLLNEGKIEKTQEKYFDDYENISDYAKEAVCALKKAGIINGVDNNNFAPKQSCTRAMAAKVIYEAIRER